MSRKKLLGSESKHYHRHVDPDHGPKRRSGKIIGQKLARVVWSTFQGRFLGPFWFQAKICFKKNVSSHQTESSWRCDESELAKRWSF